MVFVWYIFVFNSISMQHFSYLSFSIQSSCDLIASRQPLSLSLSPIVWVGSENIVVSVAERRKETRGIIGIVKWTCQNLKWWILYSRVFIILFSSCISVIQWRFIALWFYPILRFPRKYRVFSVHLLFSVFTLCISSCLSQKSMSHTHQFGIRA